MYFFLSWIFSTTCHIAIWSSYEMLKLNDIKTEVIITTSKIDPIQSSLTNTIIFHLINQTWNLKTIPFLSLTPMSNLSQSPVISTSRIPFTILADTTSLIQFRIHCFSLVLICPFAIKGKLALLSLSILYCSWNYCLKLYHSIFP